MQILSLNFFIYTVAGIWRPIQWSSNWAILLYNMFTFFIIVEVYLMMLTQFLDIVFVIDNMDDFFNDSLLLITIVVVCCKTIVVVVRRNAIIDLVQILLKEPCKPRNETEVVIQKKFDDFIRSWSIKYSFLATCSFSGFAIMAVPDAFRGHLPFNVWLPYDPNKPLMFLFTTLHQMTALIFATIINVGTETLIFGLFLQTCAQLEIFECRLHKLVVNKTAGREYFSHTSSDRKETIISEHIRHHLQIYNYAERVNSIFNVILFFQFVGSILILCTVVYYLSIHTTRTDIASFSAYTICMFAQIYVYCWSGNEVILKSTNIGNAVYETNWFLLSVSERKDFLMIMKRSTHPIKFTSSFLISFSLESYSNVLKTSYSVFNVLQQS